MKLVHKMFSADDNSPFTAISFTSRVYNKAIAYEYSK